MSCGCNRPAILNDCINRTLFGMPPDINGCPQTEIDGCLSPTVTVFDRPIVIRGFGLADGEKIYVEMLSADGDHAEAVRKGCGCCLMLSKKKNQITIETAGRYRLNRCVCSTEPLSDAYVEWDYQTVATPSPLVSGCGCAKS